MVGHHSDHAACPPTPSNMEIGRWLPLDRQGNKEDIWAEAYCGSLQRMAEASVGCSWETEGEGMVLKVSPLVLAFLTAMTGRSVNPSSARECWPAENDIIPRQPMNPFAGLHNTHAWIRRPHEALLPQHGTCSPGPNLIRTFGRKTASLTRQGQRWT